MDTQNTTKVLWLHLERLIRASSHYLDNRAIKSPVRQIRRWTNKESEGNLLRYGDKTNTLCLEIQPNPPKNILPSFVTVHLHTIIKEAPNNEWTECSSRQSTLIQITQKVVSLECLHIVLKLFSFHLVQGFSLIHLFLHHPSFILFISWHTLKWKRFRVHLERARTRGEQMETRCISGTKSRDHSGATRWCLN